MAIEAVQARRTLGITVNATGPLMMKMKRADESSWNVMRVRDRKPGFDTKHTQKHGFVNHRRKDDLTPHMRSARAPTRVLGSWLSRKQSIGSRAPAHRPVRSCLESTPSCFLELAYMRRKGLEASSRLDCLNAKSSQSRDLPVRPVFLNRYRYSTVPHVVARSCGCVGGFGWL